MEPASTVATSFAISKFYYAIAALFMGMVVMFMRNKPTLKNHGKAASGAIVGGVSVGSGIIFGGAVAVYFGLDPNDANVALAVGGGIGLFAVGIITLVANFLDKTEDKDLLEVAAEVKALVSTKKATPAKKVAAPAAKTVRKVRAGTHK